ncbi:DEAD/DEAH box helicase [Prevotella multiformis]|uniref:DEAD/DEAH box helicase n=1 Tax=Prevotella multiformis DSM 16608 TaxID=888743 RepID=F0F7V6_9BACT|nr:DEAD/DEAH box helicase [Prevotella multiformis]EGC19799.1 DEAD/DEAH box helicase [Prevotella multiformis DSM 16608]QUB71898.1 DEAD/DEAH box helicase [Prevotella multiformis]
MNSKILTKLGITLNAMQEETADAVLHTGKDVVVISPTGSGKTYAYLLPLIQRLKASSDELQAVVLVPGRELALQSASVLKDMGSGLRAMALYGGRPAMEEHRALREVKPQIVFATPGRLNDHLDKANIDAGTVKWLVIDEFDKCLELGFQEEMMHILSRLPGIERRILLSATESESIPDFVSMGRTVRLDYRTDNSGVSDRIRLYTVASPEKDKLETLSRLLLSLGDKSSIVFLNYRDSVERTALFLKEKGFTVSWFHGGLEQHEREAALYRFSNGSAPILVSTDLASRGLDIPDVDNIIHYHLPETEENYVHRVGRTARWDKEGKTFFVLGPGEHLPEYAGKCQDEYQIPERLPSPSQPRMGTIYIGKGKKDKISKMDIVGFLCKKGGLNASEIGKIDVKDRFSYVAVSRRKIKELLRLTKGEKIKGIHTVVEEVR